MTTAKSVTVTKRASDDRGTGDFGWLHAKYSFSFGEYRDSAHMGYRSLRVINEDIVEPGMGFGTHPHENMEIITYVIEGQLAHKDSMGNGRTIGAGQLQYMSAASGVHHSEFNPSNDERTHLLQIWIRPSERGGEPRYADLDTREMVKDDTLTVFASGDGRDGSVEIRQDAEVCFARTTAGGTLTVPSDDRFGHHWVQVIRGAVRIGGESFGAGDGAAVEGNGFDIATDDDAEMLVFRLN
ncbi:MAG: pirin family protein [Phycisphaeraceae bacterium]|nr:pirin family protein [Phycisphaeraceae bacterium]